VSIPAGLAGITLSGWPLSSVMPPLGALRTAPGSARAHARAVLATWRLGGLADAAELVVSELVTNALEASTAPSGGPLYAGGRMAVVGLRLRSDTTRLLIEVYDTAPGSPVLINAGADAESGRGLLTVHALTGGRWGWHPLQGQHGKCVWAELSAEQ